MTDKTPTTPDPKHKDKKPRPDSTPAADSYEGKHRKPEDK